MMRLQAILLAAACGVAVTLCAQQPSARIVDLKAYAKIEVPMTGPATQSRGGICDGAGNVYLRRIASEEPGQERAAIPIRKISREGNLMGSFHVLDAFQNLQAGRVVNVIGKGFFVTADGKVFALVFVGCYLVVRFEQQSYSQQKRYSDDILHWGSPSAFRISPLSIRFMADGASSSGDFSNSGHRQRSSDQSELHNISCSCASAEDGFLSQDCPKLPPDTETAPESLSEAEA
jgi:hypothetical protein